MQFSHPLFAAYLRRNGLYSEELMSRVAETGSLQGIAEVPQAAKRLFVTTHQIAPRWHVRMQAAFQQHIDAAVSKTINFPHTATIADAKEAYLLAFELGCKGITIYRDGSREKQVLSTSASNLGEP